MSTKETEDRYELPIYPRRDIVLVKGKGALLYDDQGNEYIDCAANVGVSNIGHGNAKVAEAIHAQYAELGSVYSMFYNPVRAKLAKKLAEIAPERLNRVFFCNSGTEAVEAAIKFAKATTGRKEVIACMRGYHGKTMGSLAATWGPGYQKPFLPMVPGFTHVPFNNFEKLEEKVSESTAAVILECVQGEGGVIVGDKEYFEKVRELCERKMVMLIIDEVQTGCGRTGTMFCSEQYVNPDMICCAKAIAGGIPMGAVLCSDKIAVPMKSHTSTFGGNPTACAAALASFSVIEEEGLVGKAKELGAYFKERLETIDSPKIREVRGLGLMIGIELKDKAGPYVYMLMELGVIALLAGPTVIRLLPPLVITKKQIDDVVEKMKLVFQNLG